MRQDAEIEIHVMQVFTNCEPPVGDAETRRLGIDLFTRVGLSEKQIGRLTHFLRIRPDGTVVRSETPERLQQQQRRQRNRQKMAEQLSLEQHQPNTSPSRSPRLSGQARW